MTVTTIHFNARKAVKTSLCAIMLLSGLTHGQSTIPETNGQIGSTQIGERQQQELGRHTVAELRRQVPFVEDYFISTYLNGLGNELSPYLPIGVPYQFYLLKSKEINAFAIQGGFAFFFTGLVNAMENEDELAGVMAHEMAHVTQHHIERMLDHNRVIDIATTAAMIGAIIAANADVANGVSVIASNYNIDNKLAFSREFEREADRVGFDALQQAQRNPKGMIDFFATLNKLSNTQGTKPPEFLSTHPLSINRMSDLEARVSENGPSAPSSSFEFDIVRARIAALYSDEQAKKQIPNPSDLVTSYMKALQMKTPLEERLSILDELFNQRNDAVFILDKAVALYDNHQSAAAVALLKEAQNDYPDNPEIPFQAAHFELTNSEWDNACTTLASMRKFDYFFGDYYRQFSRCEYERGNEALSQFYLGNYYKNLMLDDRAKEQYDRALRSDQLSQYHRALAEQYSKELSANRSR